MRTSTRLFLAIATALLARLDLQATAPAWWGEQGAVAPQAGTGLTGQYFDNVDFTSPTAPPGTGTVTTPTATRVDATLNFNWGAGAPHPSISPGSYSVQWSGQIQPRYSEAYTFSTTSNDGARVWINGVLVIDHWITHEEADRSSAAVALTANQRYDIRVDYYQNTGTATLVLRWSSASQSAEVIPAAALFPNSAALVARNDYAAVNLGQVKNLAAKAVLEMNAKLPGGAGAELNALVASWQQAPPAGVARNDYAAITHGQLKALAKKFYDRLAAAGYKGPPLASGQAYPWTSTTADDTSFHPANIGQVKRLFSFIPALGNRDLDIDGDGMTNGWEVDHNLDPISAGDALLFSSTTAAWANGAAANLNGAPPTADGSPGTGGLPSVSSTEATTLVGTTSGSLQVDKSGAATYSVPLWVVPGTAGMQPQLSLNYSSQGGAGWLGFGWSLGGASAISRGPATLPIDNFVHGVDFSSADRYYLDGQRLIAVSGADGEDGTEYRTEIDSISKVISYRSNSSSRPGPDSFKVWTKAGLVIEFGTSDNSVVEAAGRADNAISMWAVRRIADTKGNYMDFSYDENASIGEHRLTRIDYTGNDVAGLSPYAYVEFVYEDRADKFYGYAAGSRIARTQRLQHVKCFHTIGTGTTLARDYELGYTTRSITGRSLLTSLTEHVGSEAYEPISFQYEDSVDGGWEQPNNSKWGAPLPIVQKDAPSRGTGFIDLNADGRPDFVKYHRHQGPDTPLPPWENQGANGLTANYYHFTPPTDGSPPVDPFSNAPVLTRVDPNIDSLQMWGSDSPVNGVNGTNFAVRWTGQIQPLYTGNYTFTTWSDDGVKLWVNGELLASNWSYHGNTANAGSIYLVAGQKYDLRMEYFQGIGGMVAVLEWESESTDPENFEYQPHEVVPTSRLFVASGSTAGTGTGLTGAYFNGQNFDTPVVTRTDETVNMVWPDSPALGVDADSFSVRWSGQIEPRYSETYTFTATTDDGVRLWVNGQQMFAHDWTNHGPTPHSGSITLVAGQRYDIVMEFFENDSGAMAKLEWESPSQAREVIPSARLYPATLTPDDTPGAGLTGTYFNGKNFETQILSRVDEMIDWSWGASPAAGVNADEFSVRWTGMIKPRYSGNYTFTTTTDDGVSLKVNGQTVITDWNDHGATANSGTIYLEAGQKYPIEMLYYENLGGANARLEWESSQQSREVIPTSCLYPDAGGVGTGLTGRYYSGLSFGSLLLTRVDSMVDFDWSSGSPDPAVPDETFTVRWNGRIQPRYTESYTFITTSDDGVRLKVNGQTVIDQWIDHAATEHTGQITLTAGQKYDIELEYFENVGMASVRLEWESAQQTREVIPSSQLYTEASSSSGSSSTTTTVTPVAASPNTNDVAAWINDPVLGWVPADGSVAGVPNFKLPAPLAQDGVDDTGSRFVDVNGDGHPDFFGRAAGAFEFYRHNGSVWSHDETWDLPLPPPADGFEPATLENLKHVSFIDLNGDGRVDLIADAFYTYRDSYEIQPVQVVHQLTAWLNTGSGWSIATQWMPPLNLEQGTRFMDVNGDGLVDQVQHWYGYDVTIKAVALNTGAGWSIVFRDQTNDSSHNINFNNGARFAPPDLLNTADPDYGQNAAIGAEIVDMNGDGLVDLITRNDTAGNNHYGVWFNTGNGWIFAPSELAGYAPPIALAADHIPSGSAFIDVTADGLPDLVQATEESARKVFPNTGQGWKADDENTVSYHLVRQLKHGRLPNVGSDFVDIDADGVVDQVWGYQESASSANLRGAAFNKSRHTDRLTKVKNGLQVEASLEYALLTQRDATTGAFVVYEPGTTTPNPDTINVIAPMAVVSKVKHDDGAGGIYEITYRYGGLRSHRERGSQGFEWQRVTDGRTGVVSETHFRQTFPFTGMPVSSTTKRDNGTTLSSSSVTYAELTSGSGKIHLPYASQTIENSYDLNGTFLSASTTSVTDMDSYGNVKSMTVGTTGGFKKTTTNRYDQDDTAKWFIGRLTKSTVVSEAPDVDNVTRVSAFRYDANNGLLTDEAVEPVLSSDQLDSSATSVAGYGLDTLRTSYEYDSYGNKQKVTVRGLKVTVNSAGEVSSAGTLDVRASETHYDSRGRLPSYMTNALGHREDYLEYDETLGLIKKLRGANLLETRWKYDAAGRKTREVRSDATETNVVTRWTASLPAGASFTAPYTAPTPAYYVETTATGAPPARAYYDKFGRALVSVTVNGDGNAVFQNTVYDNRSRTVAKSNPYLANHTVYYATTEEFDLLDRPTKLRTPADDDATARTGVDGQGHSYTETNLSYTGFTTAATDGRGHTSKTVKNTQGWTTTNTRNFDGEGDAPAATVTYKYDAVGNLRETDAAGTVTALAYDARGRKTSMTDADMGTWHYRYNVFGELIWQKDAKAQVVTLAYDALGRMTSRTEPEGTTTWTYDTAAGKGIGKLHTVSVSYTHTSGAATAESYSETYVYDEQGRLSSVSRGIVGESSPLSIGQTYDSVGRPSVTTYPTSFQVKNYYNANGYLRAVRREDTTNKEVYWLADAYDASGRVTHETYGNGLEVQHGYSEATGRLGLSRVGISTGQQVQYLQYSYDQIGNVLTRADGPTDRTESFAYDGLDRLRTHVLSGAVAASSTVTYTANGNIDTKTGVGTYAYGASAGPHAVTSITGTDALAGRSFLYDGVGNQTYRKFGTTVERAQSWTSFNQVRRIEVFNELGAATKFSEFAFGAGHERVRQLSHLGTTTCVGSLFERFRPSGPNAIVEDKHYIYAPTGRVAVYVQRSNQKHETNWFHTDGLGSITGVTNAAGVLVQRFAFDAWGKRVNASTNGVITGATSGGITRGYTDHEQLDDLGLIHMNGRVYDPVLGRFLSADPNVDDATDAQGFNRYSYVGNNPMNATDPSGYFKLKDALKIAAVIVVGVIAAMYLGPVIANGLLHAVYGAGIGVINASIAAVYSAVGAGIAGGFASGFAGSLLNGGSIGDAFKAGVIGAAIGAVSGYAGAKFVQGLPSEITENSIAYESLEGAAAGATSAALETAAYGGKFGENVIRGAAINGAARGAVESVQTLRENAAVNARGKQALARYVARHQLTADQADALAKILPAYAAANSLTPVGALIGGAIGGGVGYLIGRNSTSAAVGAFIGGAWGLYSSGLDVRLRLGTNSPDGSRFDGIVRGLTQDFSIPIQNTPAPAEWPRARVYGEASGAPTLLGIPIGRFGFSADGWATFDFASYESDFDWHYSIGKGSYDRTLPRWFFYRGGR
ncbi:MAG: VCBS repeat-containing protein [Opitutae bacterium]|nr:VCBS repeat-containing protein [Opitutae bacterium]